MKSKRPAASGRGSRAPTAARSSTVTTASGRLIRKIQRQRRTRPATADERADRGGDAAEPRPGADRRRPGRRGRRRPGSSPGCPGVSSAPPTPCRTRAAISTSGVGREPAQQRRQREPDGADHEDPAPAEPVPERAAEQDQRGQREQVAVGDPLQLRPSEASRSSPIVRSATLTTVPSSIAMPEPSTAAATTARPVAVPIRRPRAREAVTWPTVDSRCRDSAPGRRGPARRACRATRRGAPADRPGHRRLLGAATPACSAQRSATSSTTWRASSSRSTATCSS